MHLTPAKFALYAKDLGEKEAADEAYHVCELSPRDKKLHETCTMGAKAYHLQYLKSLQCPLINDLTSASGGECPGGSVDACIDEACVPLENVIVYAACAKGCGKRCPNK